MKITGYALKARIAPAAITALIPILVFNHFFVSEEFRKLVGDIMGLKIFSALTISGISIVFLAELSRMIGKQFFQMVMFEDELRMPTTELMLYSNSTYSAEYKARFRARILKDFSITLPTFEEERSNETEARKRIAEAVTAVRKKLHGNSFLLQHNIEYGAIRNSIGGACLAVFLSVLDALLFSYRLPNQFAANASVFLAILYFLWAAIGPWLVKAYGRNYARILFREFSK